MRGINTWSYAPYKPLLSDVEDIYICRVAPNENSIHLEWLGTSDEYKIYYRKRNGDIFISAGKTTTPIASQVLAKRTLLFLFLDET